MSDLEDAVLFVCGGGAGRMVAEHPPKNIRLIHVNPKMAMDSADPEMSTPLASGNIDSLKEALDGIRVAFIFAILGGDSGTEMIKDISVTARECGCKVVSIAGIPMVFENFRRKRALESIPEVIERSDCLFLMDMGAVVSLDGGKTKIDAFFRINANAMRFAIDTLSWLVEGPFFSTFSEKVYTFSVAKDMRADEAVLKAIETTVFPTDPSKGRAVVAVSSAFGPAQFESIFERVASSTGMIPDIVRRGDQEDTRAVVFIPVKIGSSPTASHS